jgi:hypothetical protein
MLVGNVTAGYNRNHDACFPLMSGFLLEDLMIPQLVTKFSQQVTTETTMPAFL